ncbi:MAG: hypothetical protein QOH90_1571 [Actinomycetota bacterium]|nr:hypothetical protein [Actinomycetota bacterium]
MGDQLVLFFFIFLALAWAAVVLPAVLRARQDDPLTASERFKRRMEMIAPPTRAWKGRWVVVPKTADPRSRSYRRQQLRRRRIFEAAVALTALSLVVAILKGGSLWTVQVAFDVACVLFVAYLVGAKRKRRETLTKVRPLVARRAAIEEITFHEPVRAYGGRR